MASVWDDFKTFVNQGSLITLAIAFVVGAAFAALLTALVTDLITPLIGVAGHIDFSAWTTTVNGSTFYQGLFLNSLISFVTIVLVIFFLIALPYQRHKDKIAAQQAATTRSCPECLSTIPLAAHRCSFCTSVVPPVAPPAPAAPAKS